jgi:translation factor GUF1, mitochondrial
MRRFFLLCDLPVDLSTKGHVDFSWEVSRSMVACQGALLLVDASQGVQAQSLSVFHAARERGLKIIPVLNKVIFPSQGLNQS